MGYEIRRHWPFEGLLGSRGRRAGANETDAVQEEARSADPARGLVLGIVVAGALWAIIALVLWLVLR